MVSHKDTMCVRSSVLSPSPSISEMNIKYVTVIHNQLNDRGTHAQPIPLVQLTYIIRTCTWMPGTRNR